MDVLIVVALWAAAVVVWIGAVVDGVRRPSDAWARVGRPKLLWIPFLLFCGNFVAGAYYFVVVRKQLLRAEQGG